MQRESADARSEQLDQMVLSEFSQPTHAACTRQNVIAPQAAPIPLSKTISTAHFHQSNNMATPADGRGADWLQRVEPLHPQLSSPHCTWTVTVTPASVSPIFPSKSYFRVAKSLRPDCLASHRICPQDDDTIQCISRGRDTHAADCCAVLTWTARCNCGAQFLKGLSLVSI